jgi:hypothetical protein
MSADRREKREAKREAKRSEGPSGLMHVFRRSHDEEADGS